MTVRAPLRRFSHLGGDVQDHLHEDSIAIRWVAIDGIVRNTDLPHRVRLIDERYGELIVRHPMKLVPIYSADDGFTRHLKPSASFLGRRDELNFVAVWIINVHPSQREKGMLAEPHLEAEALKPLAFSLELSRRKFHP